MWDMTGLVDYSEEVKEAVENGVPLVALESTVISHGLPYPHNYETALSLEVAVRMEEAVPATIALKDGRIKVGLSHDELLFFAKQPDILKVSRRDFSYALAIKKPGATTVSATMMAAYLAGISIFATGGIGGVHRGAEESFDISADLYEFQQTPVAVVCSGAKSILDLPKTLEVLESLGVPVVGYRSTNFPAFYTQSSGLPVSFSLETCQEIASFCDLHWSLSGGGIVVANPIPHDKEIPQEQIEDWVNTALIEASHDGIHGKAVTPFLLKRLGELSELRTMEANIALLKNNASLAARIAVAEVL